MLTGPISVHLSSLTLAVPDRPKLPPLLFFSIYYQMILLCLMLDNLTCQGRAYWGWGVVGGQGEDLSPLTLLFLDRLTSNIILLCPMPENFTCQGRTSRRGRV